MGQKIEATLKNGHIIKAANGEFWDDGKLFYIQGQIRTAVFQTADLATLFAEEV